EVAAWAQPGGDALEQRALLGARDVADRVESGDPVEAGWWQFDRGHLGLDEAGTWYVLAGKIRAGCPTGQRRPRRHARPAGRCREHRLRSRDRAPWGARAGGLAGRAGTPGGG